MQSNNEDWVALIYARVSSLKQASEGSGLDSQEFRCRQHALQKGYLLEPIEAFRDSFSGGGDFMLRPAMRELLAYIDAHPHKKFVVIFDDLKRFARDTVFHIKLRAAFKSRDVKLECLNFNFEDTPEGEFIETMFAASSQLERKQGARQVVQKQKAILEAGGYSFGGKKIGYARAIDPSSGKKIMKPNKDAPFVKEALEGFAHKRFVGQIDVARFLKEEGVFGKQTVEHCLKTVRKMLEDIFYAGFVEYTPWEVSRRVGWHEALITLEVHELIQKRLKAETAGKRFRYKHNPDFVLCGLVNCADCGASLRAYWSGGRKLKYPLYDCKTKTCPLYSKSFKRGFIEGDFNELLGEYKAKPGLIAVAADMFEDAWKAEYGDVRKREISLAAHKRELEGDVAALGDKVARAPIGSVLEVELGKRLEEKAKELEKLSADMSRQPEWKVPYRTAAEKVFGTLESPLKIWTSASVDQKQKLFFFFFDERLVYEREKGYRTAQLSPVLRLFERLDNPNSLDVEMAGIEPACNEG